MEARDRLIFSMIFYLGISQQDLIKIKYDDFIGEDGEITDLVVHTKNKEVKRPLTEEIVKEVKNYEDLYSKAKKGRPLDSKGIPYFRNKHGDPLKEHCRSIRRNLEGYAKKAGLADITPKSLGFSYIERGLINQVPVKRIAYCIGVYPEGIRRIKSCLPYFIAKKNK